MIEKIDETTIKEFNLGTLEEWLGSDPLKLDMFNKKYLDPGETFPQWLYRVSGGDLEIATAIYKRQFLFGGRILHNRGNHKATMMNCYSEGYIEDDYKEILESMTRIGLVYKSEGGEGISLSKLRPKGTPIGGRYESDGIIPFMEMYNAVTKGTSQGGARKGALMISLDVWHKESKDFISLKSNQDVMSKANLSLEVDDDFMKDVKDFYAHNKETVRTINRTYSGHKISYDIKPIDLYKEIIQMNYDWGEPGCLFTNRFRNYNIMEFDPYYKIETCNPCVSGETEILTDKGYQRIDRLVGQKINIWNGYEFSEVIPAITGNNQPMNRITFSDGSQLDCTNYHKFILKNGDRVESRNLSVGDTLIKYGFPIIDSGVEVDRKTAYTQGFFMGDGSIESKGKRKWIYLYGDKKAILDNLHYDKKYYSKNNVRIMLHLKTNMDIYDKKFVPDTSFSIQTRLDWLAGYIDSDGSNNSKEGSITISSINKEVLMNVKKMLNTLGVNSWVSIMKKACDKKMPTNDGTGSMKTYSCKESYRIVINATMVQKLMDLGLKTHRIKLNPTMNRDAGRFTEIKSIEAIGIADQVYCFTESKNHSGIFNGVLTANCGEQSLPKHGACCLGSINLSELVVHPFSRNARFDYTTFLRLIKIGVKALDAIIDENMNRHALKESAEVSYNYRNIGLGVFGYASMLMKLGIKYGTAEAIDFTDGLFDFMFRQALLASSSLAFEKGSFPKYSNIVWESSIVKKHFDEDEIALMKASGLRNCSLLSIAPTGSIATMLGETGGIEPEFALKFTRKTESLNGGEEKIYDVYCRAATQYMEMHHTDILPDYFLTSADIAWEDRLNTQSVIQEHIDTAISSTVNLPEETTLEDMEMLYLRAWELGLKGVTVFRSGCKRFPILKTDKETKSQFDEPKTEENEQNIAYNSIKPTSRKTLGTTNGNTYCKKTACGTLYITINRDQDGHVVECFVNTSKGGICQATVNGLNRMISLAMRAGVELDEIVDQLKGITCMACAKRRDLDGISCPDIIGRTIEEFTKTNFQTIIKEPPIAETIKSKVKIIQMQEIPTVMCPECGSQMANMEGCVTCLTCGFSKCG